MKTKPVVCFSGWVLVILLTLGWALVFSTDAVLASDTASTTFARARRAEWGVGGVLQSTDEDSVLFFPIVVKYWPPVPPTPVLQDLESPIWDSDYAVRWHESVSTTVAPVISYTLQESSDPTFADVMTYSVLTTSVPYPIHQKPWGTMGNFYYRVKAHNAWNESPWSETKSALLLSISDGFDYPQTGWQVRRTSAPDIGDMASWYEDGDLITLVEDRFDFAIFSPMREAPPLPTGSCCAPRSYMRPMRRLMGLSSAPIRGRFAASNVPVLNLPPGVSLTITDSTLSLAGI